MKKLLFLSFALLSVILDGTAFAAPAARGGRATAGRSSAGAAATTSAPKTMSARAATGAKTAPQAGGTTATAGKTAGRTMAVRGGTSSATTAPKGPTVSARAATTQKVVGTGTKVAGAAKNIVVSEECQAKYEGCMDAFCMIDNDSGGRCICSDKNAELDAIFAEIEKLDEQSYQMATLGVEKLEMGADADAAIAAANSVADSLKNPESADPKKRARKALDLSMWDATAEFEEEEDIFAASSVDPDSLDGKEGDALHKAAAALCKAQIPECAKDINMLQMMYGQKIKSDCTAYENVLKQKKTQSAQKLQAAERALRETALEQYQNANKYDLGQCTIKFKECMQTTAGCGNDFASCASVAAFDSTNTRKSSSNKSSNYQIKGAVSNIEISASTYDALMAKKPLCESVTKQCTKVASQVWDTFLKEVAPQLKSAEIIAEDNARQDCIGNISSCFQKACKDTIDPNDPDGSYDMCLSRPEAMLNVCKVPLNACGINASSAKEAQKSIIWDFVTARLAAMRVDACTTEVKECLIADDVCGKDYLNCIGLDTDTIMNMCPRDKLTACYSSEYGDNDQEREDYIYSVAQGLILNIDNEMMAQCQKAANEAMIKVCGSTESCDSMTIADGVGAHALEYKICEYGLGTNNQYGFSNCKQDMNLIMDEDLLGTVEYKSGQMYENTLSFENRSKLEGMIAELNEKASKAVGMYKQIRLHTAADNLEELKASEVGKLTQNPLDFKYRQYSGYKQFAGMLDGVIAWNKINVSMQDVCPYEIPAVDTDGKEVEEKQQSSDVMKLCISGIEDAALTVNAGQNEATKQDQILSDLGALKNSINNTIYAIESDPTVQFCMTGRRVQGLEMGKDGAAERTEARFPGLIDSMKVVIAQSAIQKAQANYNKKYAELDEKLRKDNVALAERIAKVRKERENADRTEIVARSCLSLGVNSALPVMTGTDNAELQSAQGYTAVSKNDGAEYRETVTTTFNPTTLVCKKCTVSQDCAKLKRKNNPKKKHCIDWEPAVEKCTETQF